MEVQRADERKKLSEEAEKRRKAAVAAGTAPTSGYASQLKLSLAEAEAQVAGLKARVADFERRHAALMARARSVPEREAEFAQLNRDYAIQKQNYETLVARRESVTMSAEVTAATGIADFRVIDPPRVSSTPVAPNKKMLIPLVLLAALGAGGAAAYLFSVVRPTIHDNRSLKRVGGRPVLGAVSLVMSPAILTKRRRSRLFFFGGMGGLAATYCAVLAAVFLRGLLPF